MKFTFKAIGPLVVCAGLVLPGCGAYTRHGLEPAQARHLEAKIFSYPRLTAQRENQILALNPTHVTGREVREVLAGAPAPHLFNIHGGMKPTIKRMVSFSEFAVGMGYPRSSIINPADGTYSFSCYENSAKIAGVVAWYYEHDGLRPMLNGHSQGGMRTVEVLDNLAGDEPLHVWNPLTWQEEKRTTITDPLTDRERPVAGLKISFASSVGAGGMTRILPSAWSMTTRLHKIPDSVLEFVGFCKENDWLGGDYVGYGPGNYYKAMGSALVHNVWLPKEYEHAMIPITDHLLRSQQTRDWINNYQPSAEAVSYPQLNVRLPGDTRHIIWAAEMWYYIKKHWVLELQRLIRARRAMGGDG